MEEQILKELKKMNNFLEAIDWKLWTLHNKFLSNNVADVISSHENATTEEEVVKVATPTYKKKIK